MQERNIIEDITKDYIVPEGTKKLWKKELEILAELDRVCKKHNLKYFADSGTLLGAVRHKGFIPWDDDIDVVMLREDYNKLEKLSSEFIDPFFLQSAYSDTEFFRGHMQLRNSNTTAIIPSEGIKVKFNQGIFLDIFPIDEISSNYIERNIKFIYIKTCLKIFRILCVRDEGNISKGKRFLKKLIRKTFTLKKYRRMYKQFEKHCGHVIFKSNTVDKVSFIMERNGYRFIPKDCYKESIEVNFEDTKIPIPKGYDAILRAMYGENYMIPMKIPTFHGELIIDTEKSYKEVLEKLSKEVKLNEKI